MTRLSSREVALLRMIAEHVRSSMVKRGYALVVRRDGREFEMGDVEFMIQRLAEMEAHS